MFNREFVTIAEKLDGYCGWKNDSEESVTMMFESRETAAAAAVCFIQLMKEVDIDEKFCVKVYA